MAWKQPFYNESVAAHMFSVIILQMAGNLHILLTILIVNMFKILKLTDRKINYLIKSYLYSTAAPTPLLKGEVLKGC